MHDLNYEIVNVVGSSVIPQINLSLLIGVIDGSQYFRRGKHAIYYKSSKYNTTVCIHKSGKIAFRGAKDTDSAKKTIYGLIDLLKYANIADLDYPKINITNIVATFDLGTSLNLEEITVTLASEDITYEPEQFPGLIYRLERVGTTILIFQSGKCIITGVKNVETIRQSIQKIHQIFAQYKLI